ncbi:MAG TPA: hypothetical protein VK171_10975 [Fimbriimonas sp.]|nr:hypothetical protein [Fimbriimonas sp.]
MNEENEELDMYSAEYFNLLAQGDVDLIVVSTDKLVRFLTHVCEPDEEEAILDALLASPSLRLELVQAQTRLEQESWTTLKEDPEFNQSILASLRAGFTALAGRVVDNPVPGFVWQAVGREWRQILGEPRFATVRGPDSFVGIKGTEKLVDVVVEVVQGDLCVSLGAKPADVYDPIWLTLHDPGGVYLPLWQGELSSEVTSLKFPQLGIQLGFEEGPVPNVLFSLSTQQDRPHQTGAIDLQLINGQTLRLPLADPITIRDGHLRVLVDVSKMNGQLPMNVQVVVEIGSIKLILGSSTILKDVSEFEFQAEVLPADSMQFAGTSLVKLVQI